MLFAFPGAFAPTGNPLPPNWSGIPGAVGCALQSITFRDRIDDFDRLGATVLGLSTQRPDQLRDFADHAGISFLLLSDEHLTLTAALLLPTFRTGGVDRLERLTLIVDPDRTIRMVQFPVLNPATSADDAIAQLTQLQD